MKPWQYRVAAALLKEGKSQAEIDDFFDAMEADAIGGPEFENEVSEDVDEPEEPDNESL